MPSRIDEAAGRHYTGGRYLFETWADVVDYERFTSQELEFEPGVKFWSRPFFQDVERFVWRVAGAHNFLPLDAHHVSRFERFRYEGDGEAALERAWGTVRDEAGARGLAAVWLLHQPEQRLIGLHTVATGLTPADLEAAPSLGALLPASLAPERYFDRSSRILSLWLPKSRLAGGAPSASSANPRVMKACTTSGGATSHAAVVARGFQRWLDVLDQAGIESTVLYPTAGLAFTMIQDPAWAVALARARGLPHVYFAAGSFDLVYSIGVLAEHVAHDERGETERRRSADE